MKGKDKGIDSVLLSIILLLVGVGFIIFVSASLGLLASEGARFSAVVFNQFFFGIFLGLILLFFFSRVSYLQVKRFAPFIFAGSVFLTLLVFIPGLGFEHGGAKRWLDLGVTTFQPGEVLKFASVILAALYLSSPKQQINSWKYGALPLGVILSIVGAVLLSQPDIDTFVVIGATLFFMYILAEAPWKNILIVFLLGAISLSLVIAIKPYARERVMTFLNPSTDLQGSGWQINQSLIAIGSGELAGKGFGQSVQKFGFLPEPIGDSIFAVASEEFGFLGSLTLVLLFLALLARGLQVGKRVSDSFGRLLFFGVVIMIVVQSFMNMGAMLGLMPLSGLPLIFVSQGGSSILVTLIMVGVMLNISRTRN